MNTVIILVLTLAALLGTVYTEIDTCVCVSPEFGCQGITNRRKLVQTGFCSKRCCKDSDMREKRECKCMNVMGCPDDWPIDAGKCPLLVECCPEKLKQEL